MSDETPTGIIQFAPSWHWHCPQHGNRGSVSYSISIAGYEGNYCDACFAEMIQKHCWQLSKRSADE